MTENVASSSSAPLFFPSPATTGPDAPDIVAPQPDSLELDPVALQAMNADELCEEILRMLAFLRRRTMQEVAAGAPYLDGTLALDSMTAVWVISTVGKEFKQRLVKLSDVAVDSLRSVGGVATVIGQAIASITVEGVA